MPLTYLETKTLIDAVLAAPTEDINYILKGKLEELDHSMPEFYDGVIRHGPGMNYTSDQWLDFHRKVPHWRLRREKPLMDKLSHKQRETL